MATDTRKSHGSALLSALFIMTLVAIAATAMSYRLQIDIYRTRLTIVSDKLYLASQAVSFWAFDTLAGKKTFIISPKGLAFPKSMARIYPNVRITGQLIDLQGQFNLNNLQDKQYLLMFELLLKQTLKKHGQTTRRNILNATRQWISPYHLDRGKDGLQHYYLQKKPPYYQPHQSMKSLSEFRLVQGVNQNIYQTLTPYLTVLPEPTPININTASKPVLMSLGQGLTETQAEKIIQARAEKIITTGEEMNNLLKQLSLSNQQVTIESQYFLCKSHVESEDISLTYYTIIKRQKDSKGRITIQLITESLNAL